MNITHRMISLMDHTVEPLADFRGLCLAALNFPHCYVIVLGPRHVYVLLAAEVRLNLVVFEHPISVRFKCYLLKVDVFFHLFNSQGGLIRLAHIRVNTVLHFLAL